MPQRHLRNKKETGRDRFHDFFSSVALCVVPTLQTVGSCRMEWSRHKAVGGEQRYMQTVCGRRSANPASYSSSGSAGALEDGFDRISRAGARLSQHVTMHGNDDHVRRQGQLGQHKRRCTTADSCVLLELLQPVSDLHEPRGTHRH